MQNAECRMQSGFRFLDGTIKQRMSLRGGGLKADDVAISRQLVLADTSLRLPRRFAPRNDTHSKRCVLIYTSFRTRSSRLSRLTAT